MALTFAEPETRRGPRARDFSEIASELREHPGRHAVILDLDLNTLEEGDTAKKAEARARNLKPAVSGEHPDFQPVGHYEATVRKNGASLKVFARYVGPDRVHATAEAAPAAAPASRAHGRSHASRGAEKAGASTS